MAQPTQATTAGHSAFQPSAVQSWRYDRWTELTPTCRVLAGVEIAVFMASAIVAEHILFYLASTAIASPGAYSFLAVSSASRESYTVAHRRNSHSISMPTWEKGAR